MTAKHTGAASGRNSSVAQLGGVAAIGLVGTVLGTRGDTLVTAFRVAVIVRSIVCPAAAATIVFLVNDAHIQGSAHGGSDAEA